MNDYRPGIARAAFERRQEREEEEEEATGPASSLLEARIR